MRKLKTPIRKLAMLSTLALAVVAMTAGAAVADEPGDYAVAVPNCGQTVNCDEVQLTGTFSYTYNNPGAGNPTQTCDIVATATISGGPGNTAELSIGDWGSSGGFDFAGMGGQYACGDSNTWDTNRFDDCDDAGFYGGLFITAGTAWSSGANHTAYLPEGCFNIFPFGPLETGHLSIALNEDGTSWTLESRTLNPGGSQAGWIEAQLESDTPLEFAAVE